MQSKCNHKGWRNMIECLLYDIIITKIMETILETIINAQCQE